MEDKGKQKENQFKLGVQLQREKLDFKKEQFCFKEKKRTEREEKYKRFHKRWGPRGQA
jgi:hypothetical protein